MPSSGGAVVAPPGRLAVKAVIKPGLVTIGLLIIATLLAAMPLAAQAQKPPPQIFVGAARVNGFPVAATIPITAWVDNRQVGETTTQSEGEFVLQVSGGEGTLSFRIGELTADQRVPWVLGGLTRGFVLTANDATDPCFTIPKGAAALAEVDHPFREIIGKATVNGLPAPPGTPITAWDNRITVWDNRPFSRQVGYAVTGAEGNFTLQIIARYEFLSFRIGKLPTKMSYLLGETIENNFTANLEVSSLCRGVGAGWAISELLGDKFTRAFHFDNNAKQWLFYDPLAGDDNTLAVFIPGYAYFILVSESVSVTLDGKYHNLSCVAGNCWNLIVW